MNIVVVTLCTLGALFFLAGTIGLLRFPDTTSRLHALTKADNVGLGFLLLGLALASGSWWVGAKLFVVWLLTMLGGTTNAYLIANSSYRVRQSGEDAR